MKITGLMNNPYAWLLLAFCTVAAFVFAIYTWIVGKKKKEFTYLSNSYKIIQKGKSIIPQLQLTYENRNIEDLSITKYAIWNSGNEVINGSDVVSEKPLKIMANVDNAIILDTKVIVESEETNKFVIAERKEKFTTIDFDYVDPRDGIVIQVVHTGKSLDIDCKIKGGKELKNLNKRKTEEKISRKKAKRIATILLGVDIFMLTGMATYFFLTEWEIVPRVQINSLKNYDRIISKMLSIIMIILVITLIHMLYDRVKEVYYINIPSKLRQDIEYEDIEN